MLVTKQPVLRRFWYALAPLTALKDGPLPATLLGEKLVLWLDEKGEPVCMQDRCCHRTMKLSKGRVDNGTIQCAYHGWTFDKTGQCIRIPQARVPEQTASRYKVQNYRCTAKHGVVWVALEEPLMGIPDLPEFTDSNFRLVPEFFETWHAPGLRIMENSFDNAHFSYVHEASFGINEEPEPAPLTIEDTPFGFHMYSDVPVKNPDLQKKNLGTDSDRTVRHLIKTWWMPFSRKMHITYPNGKIHVICTLTAPIDDRSSTVIQFALRNDTEADAPAADVVAFDRQVTNEDKAVLQECEFDIPLDIASGEEFHMPSDKPGIAMRRRLRELLAQHGERDVRIGDGVEPDLAASA
jgi:phenylpropionate dioxygenase-like ring-hydroxylating dioxygenase large terminal subunit